MLATMRKWAGSLPIKILLGLIVASFAVWGVGDIFSGSSRATIATVGSENIGPMQYEEASRAEMQRYSQILGGQVPDVLKTAIQSEVLDRLVNQLLLEQAATGMKVYVNDQVLVDRLRKDPLFQENGVFSQSRFLAVLHQNGYTEKSYLQRLRKDLSTQTLIDSVIFTSIPLEPQAEILHRYRREAREAAVLTIPLNAVGIVAEPTAEELDAFFKQHGSRFATPEYRRISYLRMTRTDVLSELKISDEDVKKHYEQNMESFNKPARMDLEQVVVDDEALAKRIYEAVEKGQTLKALNKQDEKVPQEWISLGEVAEDELPAAAADILKAAKPNSYTAPVKSDFGFHIYHVKERKQAGMQPLEEVRERIQQEMVEDQLDDAVYRIQTQIEDALAGGAKLHEAAVKAGLQSKQIGPLDREGKQPDGTAVKDIPVEPFFLSQAFSQAQNGEPKLVLGPDQAYYAFQAEEITPPRNRTLEEVRAEVVNEWKSAEREKRQDELAKKVVEALNTGQDAFETARSFKLAVPETKQYTRFNQEGQPNPDPVATALFGLQKDGVTGAIDAEEGNLQVAKLTKVVDASAPTEEEKEALLTEMEQTYQQEILAQYTHMLRGQYPVTIHRAPRLANPGEMNQ